MVRHDRVGVLMFDTIWYELGMSETKAAFFQGFFCMMGPDDLIGGLQGVSSVLGPGVQPSQGLLFSEDSTLLSKNSHSLTTQPSHSGNSVAYQPPFSETPDGERHIEAYRPRQHGACAREHDAQHYAEEGVVDREPQDLEKRVECWRHSCGVLASLNPKS